MLSGRNEILFFISPMDICFDIKKLHNTVNMCYVFNLGMIMGPGGIGWVEINS